MLLIKILTGCVKHWVDKEVTLYTARLKGRGSGAFGSVQ